MEGFTLAERGGQGQTLDRRVYLQLQAWTGCGDPRAVVDAVDCLPGAGVDVAVYEAVNDPTGVAVAVCCEDPAALLDVVRPALAPLTTARGLTPVPGFSMLGRSYSIGYEADLAETLLHRPRRHLLDDATPWAVWYPLRRSGAFARLPREEQMSILKEHGDIGMRFGRGGHAQDIRLACHGLDAGDNDFVIGLMGAQLHPLSALVQAMRPTVQTSTYLAKLGPFFVGRRVHHAAHTPVPDPPARP